MRQYKLYENVSFLCIVLIYLILILKSQMATKKPKIIVFDLDYTLWPFWVDTHVSPPFKKGSNGVITDSVGSKISCYPEVQEVLKTLHNEGYILGVASRTSEIKGARQLIHLLGWDKYFSYKEIFPGQKITHFKNIKEESGVEFNEIIFFDDEQRNIHDVSRLGVASILVRDGVSRKVVENGLRVFASEKT